MCIEQKSNNREEEAREFELTMLFALSCSLCVWLEEFNSNWFAADETIEKKVSQTVERKRKSAKV